MRAVGDGNYRCICTDDEMDESTAAPTQEHTASTPSQSSGASAAQTEGSVASLGRANSAILYFDRVVF